MRRFLLVLTAFLSLAGVLAAPAQAAWLWPVRGDVITPYRNGSDPYAGGQHRGIDIAVAAGTPVVAAASGEVRFAGTAGSSGLTVSVRTGDGFDTSYLHLSSLAVRAGAHVSGGERLGAVGTTGERSAAAPHLHFGVREAGTRNAYLDPLSFLPPPPAPPPGEAPHPGPAPAPAPLVPRPTPSPAPAPGGVPRPAPAPGRAPRPAPTPGRAPRSVPAPGRAHRPAPAPGRAPGPATARDRVPRFVPAPWGRPRLAPAPKGAAPVPAGVHGRAPTPGGVPQGQRAHSAAPTPSTALGRAFAPAPPQARSSDGALAASSRAPGAAPASSSSGPDFGWALACSGLLLAAGILGLTGESRKVTTCSRSRLAGALRPPLGRR